MVGLKQKVSYETKAVSLRPLSVITYSSDLFKSTSFKNKLKFFLLFKHFALGQDL